MRIKLHITDGKPHGYTTVGYWMFDQPNNKGTLHLEVAKLPDWRYSLAVIGHEFIEAVFCWLFNRTTEECDVFDDRCEREMESGARDPYKEPGFDSESPYYGGHVMGSWWEWFVIHLTFASWTRYNQACNEAMGL